MESINGSAVLRPTRIGFLVRPTQHNFSKVREIMRMCTCLWGGMFNPIIPVCNVLPPPWRREHFKEITAKGLADAYIRFFEPDVFVETEKGLAAEAGITNTKRFMSERVISLSQLARTDRRRDADFAFGLSMMDVYRELYQEEFKFVARKKRQVAVFADESSYCEAVFGAFPDAKPLAYMKKAFIDVCAPESVPATAEDCLKVFRQGHLAPLNATLYEVDVSFSNRDDPIVFVFDPDKTVDLIDFWNLRQFRPKVLPINVHWFSKFADMIRKFVNSNFRPLPGNPQGIMIHTTLEFARSIDDVTKNALTTTHLSGLAAGSLVRKDWYDPIWRTDWKNGGIQPRRASLEVTEVDFEEKVDKNESTLAIPSPVPKFASKYSLTENHTRWINVIKLANGVSGDSRFSLAFPPNVKGGDFPALGFSSHTLCTREGIVLPRQYKMSNARLGLLSQQDAVIGWLAAQQIATKTSSSGRNAEQFLLAAGGTPGCHLFADEGTVRLLDKMAKTIHRDLDGTTAQYPDRTASISEWKEVLGRRSKALFSRAKLSDFTDHNVMRLGLSLACPHCAKENWYSLTDIGYEITCERCLNNFPFPQAGINFNESDWRFRVSGPFSVPDYADGAYATVLTLRLFNNTLQGDRAPTTFATGLDIVLGQSKFEVDFVGWYSEGKKFWIDPSPVVVFGEAKSFGVEVFKERDIQRLKVLAEAIPGAYVVFSTLKKELSKIERRRIRKFAEWGRVPQKNGEARAMAIVLTGTELFADFYVKQAWDAIGGAHAASVKHPSVNIDDLWTLADITQQLYLEMPPYWTWRDKRLRKRKVHQPNS